MQVFYVNEMFWNAVIQSRVFLKSVSDNIDYFRDGLKVSDFLDYGSWHNDEVKIIDIVNDIERLLFENYENNPKFVDNRYKIFEKDVRNVGVRKTFESRISVGDIFCLDPIQIRKLPLLRDHHFKNFQDSYIIFFDKSEKNKLYISDVKNEILLIRLVDYFGQAKMKVMYATEDYKFDESEMQKERRIVSFFIKKPIVVIMFNDGLMKIFRQVERKRLFFIYAVHPAGKKRKCTHRTGKIIDVVVRNNVAFVIYRFFHMIGVSGFANMPDDLDQNEKYIREIPIFEKLEEKIVCVQNSLFISVGTSIVEIDLSDIEKLDQTAFKRIYMTNSIEIGIVDTLSSSSKDCELFDIFSDFCVSKDHLICLQNDEAHQRILVFSRKLTTCKDSRVSTLLKVHSIGNMNSYTFRKTVKIFAKIGRFLIVGDFCRQGWKKYVLLPIIDIEDGKCVKILRVPTQVYESYVRNVFVNGKFDEYGKNAVEIITFSSNFEFCKFQIDFEFGKSRNNTKKNSSNLKTRICGFCDKIGIKLKVCGLCKKECTGSGKKDECVFYCSVKCQKNDWKEHRKIHKNRYLL